MGDAHAYHITWTTYGTWLPGDERGWVARNDSSIRTPSATRYSEARTDMSGTAVVLDPPDRQLVHETITAHCQVRGWRVHALNVRSNHVHIVLTAVVRPEKVLSELKSWASRALNVRHGSKQTWWTYHGSTKWIFDDEYFAAAVRYVKEQ